MKARPSLVLSVALVASLVAPGALLGSSSAVGATTTPNCVAAQLRLTKGQPQGTAGTTYVPLIITNAGRACAIWGVAAVQPVSGAARRAVGPLARNTAMGEMPVRHVLAKGASVSDAFGVVETGNYPASSCVARRASGVEVSLGSFLTKRYLAMAISVCTKRASTTTRLLAAGTQG
ncbi:MAG: DUF4232 domain-containing protein [Acidobacteriota bacterium]|nr:DUF4232 domain-containing protein [Acidobacteriota bacterium]MDE3044427.1 DUF4232 domain-containing protein [Acidobacteriota bacterium]MDE3107338.1 DUF4232 domain-containing protein [Acidobacteriota bacterium]